MTRKVVEVRLDEVCVLRMNPCHTTQLCSLFGRFKCWTLVNTVLVQCVCTKPKMVNRCEREVDCSRQSPDSDSDSNQINSYSIWINSNRSLRRRTSGHRVTE